MTGNYNGVVVVIPTRNRASLAMNAIHSVLDQPVDDLHVLVSDNSTSDHDRHELESFCATLADQRVRYVRPPEPLAMPAHWQWAIEQALANYNTSHFSYLTDRMMFRLNALGEILGLAALYPDKIITYNHDRICDNTRPIRIEEYEVTGRLLEIESRRLLWLVSESILHHALPRMLNCIVPGNVLQELGNRFGNVFSSIAPDFNFCFRCLDVRDSILFYDKSPLFHYALDRSLGVTGVGGASTPETDDFAANLAVDSATRNYATPIPSLITATNAVFNEYLIYKQETGSVRFCDVDAQKYLRANAAEIAEVRNSQLRAQMHALLVEHGYHEDRNGRSAGTAAVWRARLSSLVAKLKRVTTETPRDPEFANLDEAIHYARFISRGNPSNWTRGAEVLQGRELPFEKATDEGTK